MFGRKKAPEDGVKAVCGYKDSQGRFWDTYEKLLSLLRTIRSGKRSVRW